MSTPAEIMELIKRWTKCGEEADMLYVEYLQKLAELKALSDQVSQTINTKLDMPVISLEGFELDG